MIPKSNCIECEQPLWDDEPGKPPRPGDLCICIFCGTINQLNNEMKLIKPKSITKEAKHASKSVRKANAILFKDKLIDSYKRFFNLYNSENVEEQ